MEKEYIPVSLSISFLSTGKEKWRTERRVGRWRENGGEKIELLEVEGWEWR